MILRPVNFTSEQIADLMNDARRAWRCPIRLKIAAFEGCTVLEIFHRDALEPSVPIQRFVSTRQFAVDQHRRAA